MSKITELEARVAELERIAAAHRGSREAIQNRVTDAKQHITKTMWMLNSVIDGMEPSHDDWAYVARELMQAVGEVHAIEVVLELMQEEEE